VLRLYLLRDKEAFCFVPSDSEKECRAARHAARTTPLSCGNKPGSNVKAQPKWKPAPKYQVAGYRRAIQRACDRAFPPPENLDDKKIEQWKADHR